MSDTENRIKTICDEFDERVEKIGLKDARLEIARALAESERLADRRKARLERPDNEPMLPPCDWKVYRRATEGEEP